MQTTATGRGSGGAVGHQATGESHGALSVGATNGTVPRSRERFAPGRPALRQGAGRPPAHHAGGAGLLSAPRPAGPSGISTTTYWRSTTTG